MASSYPGTLRAFPIHVNTTEVVDASHVNELQDEVTALETFIGTNPHVSSASTGSSLGAWASSSRTYATLSDRLANAEAGHLTDTHTQYIRFTATETISGQKTFTATNTFFGAGTGATSGLVFILAGTSGGQAGILFRDGTVDKWSLYRDSGNANFYLRDTANGRAQVTYGPGASDAAASTTLHSQLYVGGQTTLYGNLTVPSGTTALGTTTVGALTLSGALTLAAGTGVVPTTSAVGNAAAGGTSTTAARADHLHGREAFSATAPPADIVGTTSGVGTSISPARSDHNHGLTSAAPTASVLGAVIAEGTAATIARSDHVHGRESFGATTTALPSPDVLGVIGSATTPARSDHTHGYTTAAAGASAPGDAAAQGAATSLAKSDHKHSREAFGAAPPAVNVTAGAAGGAATLARSDHNHSVSVGSPVALQTFGLVPADGTSTALARADHSHGTPAAPTAASTGSVAKAGDTMTGALTVPSPLTINDGTLAKTTAGTFTLSAALAVTSLSASGTVTGTTGVFDGANRVYSSGNPPPSAAPVVIMPFFVGGSVGTGLRRPEFIATVPMTIRGARSRSFAGSGTYTIFVNGANISGAASAFSTTQALFNFTDVDIVAGDRVQVNVDTASADAVDLSVTVDVVTR